MHYTVIRKWEVNNVSVRSKPCNANYVIKKKALRMRTGKK